MLVTWSLRCITFATQTLTLQQGGQTQGSLDWCSISDSLSMLFITPLSSANALGPSSRVTQEP
jgi:hypothetical protein